jgi:peptidoglycan hydrolase-like protein with peptidoglycan-binding domain
MISTVKFWKNIGLSMVLMSGMSFLAGSAQARVIHTRGEVASAQRRLRMKGYYHGPINGLKNRRTVRALRNFQFDHNLSETGTLNSKTCRMLGASCKLTMK